MFVVQRDDASAFAPNDPADPAFGEALRQAYQLGVEVYAYSCQVSPREITLAGKLPLLLHRTNVSEAYQWEAAGNG